MAPAHVVQLQAIEFHGGQQLFDVVQQLLAHRFGSEVDRRPPAQLQMPLRVFLDEPPHRTAVPVIHADASEKFHAAAVGKLRHQLPEIDPRLPQRAITAVFVGMPPMFLQYLGGTVKRLEAVADHHGQRVHSRPGQFIDATGHHGPHRVAVHRTQRGPPTPELGKGVTGIAVVQNTALPSGRPRGLLGDRAASQQNEKHRCDPPRLFHGQNPFMQCRFQPDLRPDRSGIPDGANLTVPSRPADHFHAPATGFHPQTERGRGLARISHRIAGLRLGKCWSSASCSAFFGEPLAYRLRWAPPGLFEIEHQG